MGFRNWGLELILLLPKWGQIFVELRRKQRLEW